MKSTSVLGAEELAWSLMLCLAVHTNWFGDYCLKVNEVIHSCGGSTLTKYE